MAIGQIFSLFPPGRNSLEDEKLALYSWYSSWFWGGFTYEYMHNRYRDHGRPSLRINRSQAVTTDVVTVTPSDYGGPQRSESSTLKQAEGRYKLKNDRDPPPGYHLFYEFAQKNGCLIDEFDNARILVHRDFEPFYQLAEHHPTFFPDMLERAMRIADDGGGLCLSLLDIKNHKMAPMLLDMGLIFNYQDEPRILFNTRRPDAYEFALNKSDQNPFRQGPRPTKEYYEEDSHHQCLLPNSEKGFGNLTNDVNAFLLSSRSTQHTRHLYPILSSARLTSCFADIVVPSLYYLWVRHGFEDNVRWEDKKSQIYCLSFKESLSAAVPQVAHWTDKPTRVTRVAWLNGLRRLAEFEFGLAGVDGVACGVA
ncbi:hypothetical protein B0H13DRAFT_2534329 [Mycena leptocephala]|nr:hypothetical protein B0H13DRAFT_2534329 [Mycena leptocephala]